MDKATLPYYISISKFHKLLKSLTDGTIPFILYCVFILKNFRSSSFTEKKYILMGAYNHYQMYLHFINHSSKKYLIVDQGLVQDVISFAYQDKISSDKYVKRLICFCIKKFGESLLVVNCDVDVETSFSRISLRKKTDGSRLDKMYKVSPLIVKEILEVQQYNFNIVRKQLLQFHKIATKSISCIDGINHNVKEILSIL